MGSPKSPAKLQEVIAAQLDDSTPSTKSTSSSSPLLALGWEEPRIADYAIQTLTNATCDLTVELPLPPRLATPWAALVSRILPPNSPSPARTAAMEETPAATVAIVTG